MADRDRIIRGNPRKTRAYVGLGSNAGDRVGFIQQAMQFLKDVPGISVVECSSLYETEPIGKEYAEWFVNAVAAIDTTLAADSLLDVCKDVEARLTALHGSETKPPPQSTSNHRKQSATNRIRIIDLDILFFGDTVVKSDHLTVPHPNLPERAYALVPLLEIAPNLMHPGLLRTVTQLHEDLARPELVYLYGTRGVE